jgi:arylsulfatase A-like enzyme
MAAESKSELSSNTLTLANILKSNGYSTGMVGMWNLGRGKTGPASPLGRGFQYFTEPKTLGFEKDTYLRKDGSELTDVMTEDAIRWMTDHKDGPFFLYFAPHAVHAPFDPKPELLAKYADKKDWMARDTPPQSNVWIETLENSMRNWRNSDWRTIAHLFHLG